MRIEEVNIENSYEKNFLVKFLLNPPSLKYLSYTILIHDSNFESPMLLHVNFEKNQFYLSHYRNFDFSIDYQSINKLDKEQFLNFLNIFETQNSKIWLKEYGFRKGGEGLYPEHKPKRTEIKPEAAFEDIAKSAWLYTKTEFDENSELIKSSYRKTIPNKRTIKNLEQLFWNVNSIFIAISEKNSEFLKAFFAEEGIKLSKEILEKTNSMPLKGRIKHVAKRFSDENYF